MKKVAIYARVSTKDQSFEQQIDVLRDYCQRNEYLIYREYVDEGVSAFKQNRPAFKALLEAARRREIDVILVYKLDRFGRSLKELVNTLDNLQMYGVDFVSYTQGEMSTNHASGKLLFHIMAAIAEFEKNLISERTKLKLDFLKQQGVTLGRPKTVDGGKVRQLREQGMSMRKIAKEVGCAVGSVSGVLKSI